MQTQIHPKTVYSLSFNTISDLSFLRSGIDAFLGRRRPPPLVVAVFRSCRRWRVEYVLTLPHGVVRRRRFWSVASCGHVPRFTVQVLSLSQVAVGRSHHACRHVVSFRHYITVYYTCVYSLMQAQHHVPLQFTHHPHSSILYFIIPIPLWSRTMILIPNAHVYPCTSLTRPFAPPSQACRQSSGLWSRSGRVARRIPKACDFSCNPYLVSPIP